MFNFAFEAVEFAEDLVEGIFEVIEGEIPGAGVVDLVTAEGFFEFSEAVPGVLGVFGSGDTPEVKGFGAGFFGVEDHFDEEGGADAEFTVIIIGGGVGVETSAVIVINKGGADGGRSGGFGVGVIGEIKSGEAGRELFFKMLFGLGNEMVARGNRVQEGSEDFKVFWLF